MKERGAHTRGDSCVCVLCFDGETMSNGRVTIPTDKNFVEGTKKYIRLWGADAVRDCDGTQLPENARALAGKVYKTYFLARGNNEWAYAHDECLQNAALMSDRVLATADRLSIDPLAHYSAEQLALNEESVSFWQVYDRTTGQEIASWQFDTKTKRVEVENTVPMHEYTINFFAKILWDATQIYNYKTNGWTITKDRDIDPVYPEAFALMERDLKAWLEENKDVNVVRFTTFFYHFFNIYDDKDRVKYFDWFGYPMSASPAMFRLFEQKFGYCITLEDLVDEGYYNNHFRVPRKAFLDYMELLEGFVAQCVRHFTDIVHSYKKEAMMFVGDNWIGAEIYGKHFAQMGLDAVVGSINSGATLRMVSDVTGVKYREVRLLPYFFPDTLREDAQCTKELLDSWVTERRALLRRPVERIGFGGYLSLADKFPSFTRAVAELCEEFRSIYERIGGQQVYSQARVAVLNAWGQKRTWMPYMVLQDACYQHTTFYLGLLEMLAGMAVDVKFISFDDVLRGELVNYDVVINGGDADTAFCGGSAWKNAEICEKVRAYVYAGGGLIGIGEPTAVLANGRFFQLSDVLGVDEEKSFSMSRYKYNRETVSGHFILEDCKGAVDYNGGVQNVYALEGAAILDKRTEDRLGVDIGAFHVKLAVNEYGAGRAVYLAGCKHSVQNTRLLLRAILWAAGKEKDLCRAFSQNPDTECHYYPERGLYALVNNTGERAETAFFDTNGKESTISLQPYELKWIQA